MWTEEKWKVECNEILQSDVAIRVNVRICSQVRVIRLRIMIVVIPRTKPLGNLIVKFQACASRSCGVDGWSQHAMAVALCAPISRAVDCVLLAVPMPRAIGQESLCVGLSDCGAGKSTCVTC